MTGKPTEDPRMSVASLEAQSRGSRWRLLAAFEALAENQRQTLRLFFY